ncbi:hypothetical protein LG651_06060 [Tamlana sp. 62-3]|uniref:Uncharacterized protein n=1 Tax=Neotamlana sargassicola TaxID=2883125 RepID=A0A9X1I6R4_9FLAO|nr:hypothetical protein [Tamlana sargassicola]MCB4807809.1 hypothetical protein [Tamlana sargassicola]
MKNNLKITIWVITVLLSLTNMTCDDNINDDVSENCDKTVVLDAEMYANLETDFFTISNVNIIDDCLSFSFSASGCSGDSWEFNLVDSEVIAESSPEQRYLKIQLINNEACLAVFTKQVSFSLKPLQINNSQKELILNIEGLDDTLTYKY